MIFENVNDGIVIHDTKGCILDVNRIMYQRLGLTRDEILKLKLQDLVAPEYVKLIQERTSSLKKNGEAIFESADKRKDGTVMPVEVSARTITYKGKPAIVSVVRDIHERKIAEELISSTLEENQLLRTDVQYKLDWWHQVLSFIVDIVSDKKNQQEIADLMNRMRERLYIFKAVQEGIYNSVNLKKVSMRNVIRNLIKHQYSFTGMNTSIICIKQKIDPLCLDIQRAFACSVIIHELVSNSLHHAFYGKSGGTIFIKMTKGEHQEYLLECKDTGREIKPEELEKFSSLGIRLINSAVGQLKGKAEWKTDEGTICSIRFAEK